MLFTTPHIITHAIKNTVLPKTVAVDVKVLPQKVRVADYYDNVTEGYQDWSSNINMHFGCYEWGINPFNLEAMLENTNRKVLQSLRLRGVGNRLLDMGCGLGATARHCAKDEQVGQVVGVTLAATQVHEALLLAQQQVNHHKLHFEQADFHHTPFANNSFEGIYAIESACHTEERDKRSMLVEALRLLKPGARIAICDGMIKGTAPLSGLTGYSYNKTCQHWSVGHFAHLEALKATMVELGFKNIQVEDLTLRMLPSAACIPWVSARYFFKLCRRNDRNPQHWHHLWAPLWGLLLGVNLRRFGYFIVTAEK